MKYKVGDVVWCRDEGKCAMVKAVGTKTYDVRTYDGKELTLKESELGKS
jgi:hypothetical protein